MMMLRRLQLIDFRCYESVDVRFDHGVTAVIGANGQGKSNLLEAIGYVATMSSFRGAPTEAMVRRGASSAILRAELDNDGRDTLIEIEVVPGRRTRIEVNRQKLSRSRDLLGVVRTTVFAPDDLVIIKGGPGERRQYLDDTLVSLHPRNQAMRTDLDRVLKQRNALLKGARIKGSRGRNDPEMLATLDVWDNKLVEVGEAFVAARRDLLAQLEPVVTQALADIAGGNDQVGVQYLSSFSETGLAAALAEARDDDLRRGVSTVGPHRDDVGVALNDMAARTHASQGEQRSLTLALRLASHRVVTEATGQSPLLLLDDVLSELDAGRRSALLRALPQCQTVLTTAADLPEEAHAGAVYEVRDHHIAPVSSPSIGGTPGGDAPDTTDGSDESDDSHRDAGPGPGPETMTGNPGNDANGPTDVDTAADPQTLDQVIDLRDQPSAPAAPNPVATGEAAP